MEDKRSNSARMNEERPCIYCGTPFAFQRGEGDHVVPQAFGRFEDEFIFRGACPSCNGRAGACEEQLIRCGPESVILRKLQPPRLRKSRGRGVKTGAHGAPAPTIHIPHEHALEKVIPHPDRPDSATHIDQIVIVPHRGEQSVVALHPKQTLAALQKATQQFLPQDIKCASLHCDERHWDTYWSLLKSLWPKATFVEGPTREPGEQRTLMRFTFQVTDLYFRAIAKTAFHYYLLNSRRGVTGSEPEFAPIRHFIMNGGEAGAILRSQDPIRSPFRQLPLGAILPDRWCHLLAMDDSRSTAQAMVQLCVGPEFVSPCYSLELGKAPHGMIVVPWSSRLHAYLYGQSAKPDYAGIVKEMTLYNPSSSLLQVLPQGIRRA